MRRLSICCLKFIFLLCVVEFVLSEEQIFFLWQRTNGSFSMFASVFQESLRIQCLVKLSALTEVLYKHLKISHWNSCLETYSILCVGLFFLRHVKLHSKTILF